MNKEDINLDKENISRIANFEAGTDGITSDSMEYVVNMEAGTDARIEGEMQDSGVTDNAPYKNLAKYKMIPDADEDSQIQNNQGS